MNSEVKNLGDVYKENRSNGMIRESFGLIPLLGGCLTSGAAYLVGTVGGTAKEAISQIPYLVGMEEAGYTLTERAVDVVCDSLNSGYDVGAKAAGIGLVGGMLVTAKFKSTIKNFLGL